MVHEITDRKGMVLALLIDRDYDHPGISFFTPPECGQQVGYFDHPPDTEIKTHKHLPNRRVVIGTTEVLYIKEGTLVTSIYDEDNELVTQFQLKPDMVLVLIKGGHGFFTGSEEGVKGWEVKTGPYLGVDDKEHFDPAPIETPNPSANEMAVNPQATFTQWDGKKSTKEDSL